ncbi:MAG: hypothetical protein K1X94_17330 [Sandaracinaceae bacterium]|nr:hypothetical protein [Sandaracinaceae bacterium]
MPAKKRETKTAAETAAEKTTKAAAKKTAEKASKKTAKKVAKKSPSRLASEALLRAGRRAAAAARKALTPAYPFVAVPPRFDRSAWSEDEPLPLECVRVALQRGVPASLEPGARDVLLDGGHPPAFEAEKIHGPALTMLLESGALGSVRTLRAPWLDVTWAVLTKLCASNTLADLEALVLDLSLRESALPIVLGSRALASLRSLSLSVRYTTDIPRGSHALAAPPAAALVPLDQLDGLPSLETLRLGRGIYPETASAILRSPLARRLHSLRVVDTRELTVLRAASLPNLRALEVVVSVTPLVEAAALREAAANPALSGLEHLDLGDANLDADGAAVLASPEAFPALRTLDLRSRFRHQRHELRLQYFKQPVRAFGPEVIARLRARFGERVLLDP